MARTRPASVRRVRSRDDRKLGGDFITLGKTGESFIGYALFKPDPELDDNEGYFEYFEHFVPGQNFVPCSGDACPLCKAGNRPNTRAKTLWLVTQEGRSELDEPELKIFNFNWSLIQEFDEYYQEDEPVLGQLWRIKRIEGQGKYAVRLKDGKLKVADLKGALKEAPDLEQIVTQTMVSKMADAEAADALADDDEDEDRPTKARGGKPSKAKAEEPDEGDEPGADEIEEETVEVVRVSKKNETLTVEYDGDEIVVYGVNDIEEYSKGDEIVLTAHQDEDGDWVADDIQSAEAEKESEGGEEEEEGKEGEGGAADELPDRISKEEFAVVSVSAEEETIDLENEEYGTFTLYFLDQGPASKVDFDDYDEGDTVIVTAVKDKDGDMVADKHVPEKKAAKGRARAGSKRK
jgi:hypothetical protein